MSSTFDSNQNSPNSDFEIKDGVLIKYHGSSTDVVIPDGVTEIGFEAFTECESMKTVHIPDSVTNIDRWAFSGCTSLISVTIPDSVTHIGKFAFDGCKSIYVKGDVEKIKNVIYKYSTDYLYVDVLKPIS